MGDWRWAYGPHVFTLRAGLLVSLLLPSLVWASGARAEPVPHTVDGQERARIMNEAPEAAKALQQAEAKLEAGDLEGAERALVDARAVDPNSFLIARRECQVLTELGKREQALDACRVSSVRSTAMDARALVGALMSGPQLATPRDLVRAVHEAVDAGRLRNQPFGDAAMCDIAHHIGDDAMMSSCVENLQRIAPDNFETKRWAAARSQSPAWALWLGWLLLGAAVVATAAHALWRWLRRPASRTGAAVASGACFVLALSGTARAEPPAAAPPAAAAAPDPERVPSHQPLPPGASPEQYKWQLSKFPINHDDPEAQIPTIEQRNKDPLEFGYFLQDLTAEALKAERQGEYQKALKYWRASAKAVPDMAVGFGKICRVYQLLGDRQQALEACSRALNLEGVTNQDYLRFIELLTQTSRELSGVELQDAEAVVTHLRAQPDQATSLAVVECRLGVKLQDVARLDRCTKVLASVSPNDPHTLTFMWSRAMMRKDYGEAERLVGAMAKSSMTPQGLAQAREATNKASAWWRRPFTDWRYGVPMALSVLLGVGGLFLLRRRLSRFDAPGAGPAPAV